MVPASGLAGARTAAGVVGAGGGVDRPTLRYDFRPGIPDLATFPRAAWLRATRTALSDLTDEQLSYQDSAGLWPLRQALADYLGRVRGVVASPDQVIVTNGFSQGLSLVAGALARRAGLDGHPASDVVVGVEDPGSPGQRWLLDRAGLSVRAIPVDADGLVVPGPGPADLVEADRRPRGGAGGPAVQLAALLVTPAHQFPTGVVMSAARRQALVGWARRTGGLIIEDDYDAEYRFDREPVGAVQGLAPDLVVYAGSTSKSLAPGLRLGWLVAPPSLVDDLAMAKATADLFTPAISQAAFAELLRAGGFDRHLRRSRQLYRRRRDALDAAVRRYVPGAALGGIPAGLHAVVTLPASRTEHEVVERAAAASVRVYPMGSYRLEEVTDAPPALVLGYAPLTTSEITDAIQLLAAAVARSA